MWLFVTLFLWKFSKCMAFLELVFVILFLWNLSKCITISYRKRNMKQILLSIKRQQTKSKQQQQQQQQQPDNHKIPTWQTNKQRNREQPRKQDRNKQTQKTDTIRIALAGKDQIKAFSLSKSDNHIVSYHVMSCHYHM